MAELRSATSIGGNLAWHSGNLRFDTQGQTIRYAGFKMYTEFDKPTAAEVGAYTKAEADARYAPLSGAGYVNKSGDTMTGKLTNTGNDIEITGLTPRLTLTETDASKTWFLMADGSSYSVRENNAGTIRFQIVGNDKTILYTNVVEVQAKNAIDASDTWLRLNNTGAFSSGVLLGGLVRTDSAFQTGSSSTTGLYADTANFNWKGNAVWHAGNVPVTATRWPQWNEISGSTVATIPGAGATGVYSSVSVTGNKAGFTGIHFPDSSHYLMFRVANSNPRFGIHDGASWKVSWDESGALNAGTVPWTKVTGTENIASHSPTTYKLLVRDVSTGSLGGYVFKTNGAVWLTNSLSGTSERGIGAHDTTGPKYYDGSVIRQIPWDNSSFNFLGDNYVDFGPNAGTGILRIGGNTRPTTSGAVQCTNGNLHIDPKDGHHLYLNHLTPDGTKTFFGWNTAAYFLSNNGDINANVVGAQRFATGADSGAANSMNCTNWFRSHGATGWYSQTYGGGIYMEDHTWIRTYNAKKFHCNNTEANAIDTAGGFNSNGGGFYFNNKQALGGTNDGWLRLNPAGAFPSGIYCSNTGVVRHDAAFTIGQYGLTNTAIMRGSDDTSWGTFANAAFGHVRSASSGAHWLLATYNSESNQQQTMRFGIQVLTGSSGTTRFYMGSTNNYVEFNNTGSISAIGSVSAYSFSGSGASLTNLNASNITSGTLSAARLEYPIVVWSGSASHVLGPSAGVYPNGRTVAVGDHGIIVYSDGMVVPWAITSTSGNDMTKFVDPTNSISMTPRWVSNTGGTSGFYFLRSINATRFILLGRY